MSPVARFTAVAKRHAVLPLLAALPLLAGCGALGNELLCGVSYAV